MENDNYLDANEEYIKYIADHLEDHIDYSEYLAKEVSENSEKYMDYVEYLSKSMNGDYSIHCPVYRRKHCYIPDTKVCNADCAILENYNKQSLRKEKIEKITNNINEHKGS